MQTPSRQLRRLLYALTDLETALRASGRKEGADELAAAATRLTAAPAAEFLEESRAALQAILLGQRDLPTELLGSILDAIADVDNLLREAIR